MKTVFISAIVASFLWSSFNQEVLNKKQQYVLNEETSVVEWEGFMPGTSNVGSFAVKSEGLEAEGGRIKSGTFIIPIASIKNFNLPDQLKPQLLDHLKSPDFFNMALHPEATFTITKIIPYNKKDTAAVAGANYLVTGDFTMLGKTNPITFPAKIQLDGQKLVTEAKFKLDRTQWGMNYATDPKAEGHYILPEVAIHLKVAGAMQAEK
ncbi:YceI family protein [Telluribacter sp. SYSU D00476]|uniref:YceI family protein n=1 Tax=Telluribacter sp. SYSU D00476 TaxID=2811430 RepID=UPI001FF2D3C9|nr:YceI family protein [Telluribacter sp. SYSU D00476]